MMHDGHLVGDGVYHAYCIRGEQIVMEPVAADSLAGCYDTRTYPERIDGELDVLRAEVATLRAVATAIVDTLAEVGVAVRR